MFPVVKAVKRADLSGKVPVKYGTLAFSRWKEAYLMILMVEDDGYQRARD